MNQKHRIWIFVLAFHLLILSFGFWHHRHTVSVARKKHLVIRTALQPKAPSPLPSPIKKASPPKKKQPPPVKKTSPPKPKQSLASKPKKASPKKEEKPNLPSKVAALSIPQAIELPKEEPPSYAEELLAFLEQMLELPEPGKVKMRLKIDLQGSLVQADILEEKSKKNGIYLKNRLPELTFPCFNPASGGMLPQEWTITFCNAEIH